MDLLVPLAVTVSSSCSFRRLAGFAADTGSAEKNVKYQIKIILTAPDNILTGKTFKSFKIVQQSYKKVKQILQTTFETSPIKFTSAKLHGFQKFRYLADWSFPHSFSV